MKHFVRILIAVLIVGLTGFGIWFFAIRDKNHEAVFNKMTAAIDHLEEVSITYKYKEKVDDKEVEVEASVPTYNGIIQKYLDVSYAKNKGTSDLVNIRANIETLRGYNEYSMEAINYYYSLTATAEDVKNKDRKDVINAIENFTSAVDTVVDIVDDCISFYYVKNVDDASQRTDILNKDKVLFKNMLNKQVAQTELYFALRDYVEKYVFDGVVPDYKSAIYNIYANQLNITCGDLLKANMETYTTANLLTEIKISDSETHKTLIADLDDRRIVLSSLNYIDPDREAAKFINSYNKLYGENHSIIAYILRIQSINGSENRNGFVKTNSAVLSKDENQITSKEKDDIAAAYKSGQDESVKPLAADQVVDIYNILSYIRNAQ